mgnify:FL=1
MFVWVAVAISLAVSPYLVGVHTTYHNSACDRSPDTGLSVSDAGVIGIPFRRFCMPERPDEDASAAEIARWMEEDFGEALAEGIEQATEEDEGDEHDE